MNASQIKKLFKHSDIHPEVLEEIDVDALLKTVNVANTDYLEENTLEDIQQEIIQVLGEREHRIKKKQQKEFCQKLMGYRYIDDIYDLHIGKPVRIIRLRENNQMNVSDHKLVFYGNVLTIKFTDQGANVLCKLPYGNKMLQYKFNHFLTFQLLTPEEQLILIANKNMEEVETESDMSSSDSERKT